MSSLITRAVPALVALIAGLAATAPAPAAHAEDPAMAVTVKKPRVEVTLLSELSAVAPGESFRLGLRFKTEPDWHVYWKNPGAIGLPTEITFEAPDGWDFGAIAFPLPHRIVSKIGDVSFGYEGELVLTSDVRVPESVLEGSDVQVTAKARWLICKENCIQGSADLALKLPISTAPRAGRVVTANAQAFDAWKARIPLAANDAKAPSVTAKAETPPSKPGEPFALAVTLTAPAGAGPLALIADRASAYFPATAEGLEEVIVEPADPKLPASETLRVRVKGKAGPLADPLVSRLDGVFVVTLGGQQVAFDATLEVPRAAGPAVMPSLAGGQPLGEDPGGPAMSQMPSLDGKSVCAGVDTSDAGGPQEALTFALALALAFVGGFILNGMPCVLPVLSIKILGLVEQAKEDPKSIRIHGYVYTAGVLLSFLVMALVILGATQATGWAGQMRDPVFVAVLVAVMFGFALSLFGVFELSLPFASRLDNAVAARHGYASSFVYGIFAVLLGTPCTAPFLGPAVAFAVTQPPFEMIVLFLMVGLGMASPFLVLALVPAWRKLVPRPGPWLTTFKRVMGFLLVGTAVFFMNTLAGQLSRDSFVGYLSFLAILSFGLFVYGHWGAPMRSRATRLVGSAVALLAAVGGGFLFLTWEPPPAPPGTSVHGGITWHEFDLLDVEKEAAAGKTVFIDFTADWCVTCKANEATAIYTDTTRRAFAELGVFPVKGDYTVHKEPIAKWLTRFGQPSVPLYVVIPAGKPEAAFALPTLVSTSDIVGGLCKAGPSTVTTAER